MVSRSLRSVILAAAWLTATATAGAAESRPPSRGSSTTTPATESGADASTLARAKALFERGATAYGQGHYYEAIEIFTETSRVYPNPQLAFNIAKAYDNLGSHPGALCYYRDYLRRSPNAPDREAVTTRVHELERALAERGVQQVTVLSEPSDAIVLVDDQPVGLTPWTGETWPGRHRIVVTHAGYTPREVVAELEPLRALDVSAALELLPVAPVARPDPAPPTGAQRGTANHVLTWVSLGVGTAALGTAIAIEASVDSNGRKLSPASAFFAGLGAAATAAGSVMLYLDLRDRDDAKEQRHAAVGFDGRSISAAYSQSF